MGDVKGTFMVQIQCRENTTWQGEILWMEKKQSSHFRSALEMLKLMDSAISECRREQQGSSHFCG